MYLSAREEIKRANIAKKEGKAAKSRGERLENNPYPLRDELFRAEWNWGWANS